MAAILWDGFNKINGFLRIEQSSLSFSFVDFNDTNLVLDIPFKEIVDVKYHRLYSQEKQGIEVVSIGPKTNVFITDDAKRIYEKIQKFIKPQQDRSNYQRN